ncbi:MAG: hypothetical protein L0312_03575, partial [Acidobacteria bacterium]|nr:hypothetical protein [Acidobacteriota bacterium]
LNKLRERYSSRGTPHQQANVCALDLLLANESKLPAEQLLDRLLKDQDSLSGAGDWEKARVKELGDRTHEDVLTSLKASVSNGKARDLAMRLIAYAPSSQETRDHLAVMNVVLEQKSVHALFPVDGPALVKRLHSGGSSQRLKELAAAVADLAQWKELRTKAKEMFDHKPQVAFAGELKGYVHYIRALHKYDTKPMEAAIELEQAFPKVGVPEVLLQSLKRRDLAVSCFLEAVEGLRTRGTVDQPFNGGMDGANLAYLFLERVQRMRGDAQPVDQRFSFALAAWYKADQDKLLTRTLTKTLLEQDPRPKELQEQLETDGLAFFLVHALAAEKTDPKSWQAVIGSYDQVRERLKNRLDSRLITP